jgi:hypothetical protein
VTETVRQPEAGGESAPIEASALGRRVIREQEEWRHFVTAHLGEGAELVYISPLDSDRRAYRVSDRMAKVQRSPVGPSQNGQRLASEYAVLQRLRSDPALDRNPAFEEHAGWEILWYDYVEGEPLSELWRRPGFFRKLRLAVHTTRAVRRLHRQGVSHVDTQAPNYIGNGHGTIHPIDFGDAVVHRPFAAAAVDVRRFLFGRYGLAQRMVKALFLCLWPNSQQLYRNVKLKRVAPFSVTSLDGLNGDGGGGLLEGWRRSARWNTTAGHWLAYSSLTIGGVHFSGWRPWLLRWTWIREAVSFEGKSVLDLGCNVGLFCSFALLEGASSAVGVDADPDALDAAALIASGLGVFPIFKRILLKGDDDWERLLPKTDIVAAMSIAEWVDDKKALLRFLSRVPELIYEGHESMRVERDRLRRAGFQNIRVLAVTERGRVLFHATRAAT